MANSKLTGSESDRFEEIQHQWLNFEAVSYDDYKRYKLYSVPLGQTIEPELIINTGSYTLNSSGAIEIEKIIHRFDDETEAAKFITDAGPENIVSYKEITTESDLYENKILIEIQVINYPVLNITFDYINYAPNKGFMLDVFKSGSIEEGGVRKVGKQIVKNRKGRIISDTYLKYFEIKGNK